MDIVLDTCPAPECNLTPRDVAGLLDQLAAYHAHFVPAFARSDQAREDRADGAAPTKPVKTVPMEHPLG